MSEEFLGVPRSGVLQISPYVPGAREGNDPSVKLIRLASNENPYGASEAAIAAYTSCANELHRYPDGSSTALRQALSDHYEIEANQIVCGAGSDELIALICRTYAGPGDDVIMSQYGFLMYKIAATACGANVIEVAEQDYTVDLDAILGAVTPSTRIVFIANPNNPTGTMLPFQKLYEFREKLADDILLVLDAAYCEYVREPGYEAGDALVEEFGNVVVMRTFSKIHGLAALRLGWAYCPPNVADMVNRVRGPFNVSAPAQAAGIAALKDSGHVDLSASRNANMRDEVTAKLTAAGYRVIPSFGNFVLVDFTGLDGSPENAIGLARACHTALNEQGILVRPVGAYGLHHHLRMTIGTADDMRVVIEAMTNFATSNLKSAA